MLKLFLPQELIVFFCNGYEAVHLHKLIDDSDLLNDFKKKFYEVYELSEKPLMEVLDLEVGIGFPIEGSMGNHYNDSFIDKIVVSNIVQKKKSKLGTRMVNYTY